MSDLRTDAKLLRALETASSRKLTADEVRRQRVSFIMGIVKDTSGITRAKIERVLADQEGKKAR